MNRAGRAKLGVWAAVLTVLGCQVRSKGPSSPDTSSEPAPATSNEFSGRAAQPRIVVAPPPPPPATGTSTPPPVPHIHPSGIRACSQDRPEMAQAFLGVDVAAFASPELRLLLRQWLAESLRALSPPGSALTMNDSCGERLFCMWLDSKEVLPTLDRLAAFISRPTMSSFAAAQNVALERAEELYQRSSTFRLHALAESIFENRADGRRSWPPANLQPRVLDGVLGPPRVAQLTSQFAQQWLQRHGSKTEITIFAPHGSTDLGDHFLAQVQLPRQMDSTSNAVKELSSKTDPEPTSSVLTIIDERYPEANLYLSWPELRPEHTQQALLLLDPLAIELRKRVPEAWVRVHRGDGLARRPALHATGALEALGQAAPALRSLGKTLNGRAATGTHPPPPSSPCRQAQVETPMLALPALRTPHIIIWGAAHAHGTEESF